MYLTIVAFFTLLKRELFESLFFLVIDSLVVVVDNDDDGKAQEGQK